MNYNWKLRIQPDGILAFNRETGINILLDEVKPKETQYTKAPRYVQLAITDYCNLNCRFCYSNKGNNFWDRGELLELIKFLDQWGVMEVVLSGGEPLLYPDFTDLVIEVWRSTRLAVNCTTNALWLPKDFAKKIQGYIGQIRISVDGYGKTYEYMRNASFEELERNVRTLRNLNLGINILVCDQTLKDLVSLVYWGEDIGVNDYLFLKPFNKSEFSLSEKGAKEFEEFLLWGIEQGYNFKISRLFKDLKAPVLFPIEDPISRRDYIYISANGFLYPNSFSEEKYPFKSPWELPYLFESE